MAGLIINDLLSRDLDSMANNIVSEAKQQVDRLRQLAAQIRIQADTQSTQE